MPFNGIVFAYNRNVIFLLTENYYGKEKEKGFI